MTKGLFLSLHNYIRQIVISVLRYISIHENIPNLIVYRDKQWIKRFGALQK